MNTRSKYSNFGNVDDYLLSLSDHNKTSLAKLRQLIRETAPQASEMMKYNMAYYEYKGMLCAFAAQKDYLSFYVLDDEQLEKYRDELSTLKISKGCIRFQKVTDFPETIVRQIVAEAVRTNELRDEVNADR